MLNFAYVTHALLLSLQVSLSSTAISAAIGLPLSALLSKNKSPLRFLQSLVNALTGFPSVLAGLCIYVLVSRSGLLGPAKLLYSLPAMVMAQILLVVPFIAVGASPAFAAAREAMAETAAGLRLSRRKRFTLLLRECRPACVSAIMMGFGRAVSEVGAVIIVGGNIEGKTRVLTGALLTETGRGNYENAIVLGLFLLALSVGVNLAAGLANRRRTPAPLRPKHKSAPPSAMEGVFPVCTSFEPGRLEASHLEVSVQDRLLFTCEALELRPGMISLLGANGSGKSTFLRTAAGLHKSAAGEIEQSAPLLYQCQEPYIFRMSVLENAMVAMADKNRTAALAALRAAGLGGFEKKPALTLSGGEKQRLCIVRSLLAGGSVVLLDEPLAAIDTPSALAMEALLHRYCDETGCLMLVATHGTVQNKTRCLRIEGEKIHGYGDGL